MAWFSTRIKTDTSYIVKKFVPQPDITTYELAFIVSNIHGLIAPKHGVRFDQKQWDELAPEYKRHFTN